VDRLPTVTAKKAFPCLRRLALALLGAFVAVTAARAQEPPPPPPPPPPGPTSEADPMAKWLDEVRAQRRAWEARRRAAKEAIDAHRRWVDPWGAAQHEAREKETERRRQAFREQIERDREIFRNQPPWNSLFDPLDQSLGMFPDDRSALDSDEATARQDSLSPPSEYQLPGWDNRWYYRGY
jgi:hypothetical protein